MIISASRRTDIPAFYSDWFINRLEAGYVMVPNPFNPKMVSQVSLTPDKVDCLVFWTKNPKPMMAKLDRLADYNYYFQFTLNPYGKDIECNVPSLEKRIDIFKQLSDRIGREKVVWRYDPILINGTYNLNFHEDVFTRITEALKDHTEKCMLGFIDHYVHIRSVMEKEGIYPLKTDDIYRMGISFKKSADLYGMQLETCTVKVDLSHLGIPGGMCVDKALIERIIGYPIKAGKDKNQRDICRCIESIDIGMYESCSHGCLYCYAIKGHYTSDRNRQSHDKTSPKLLGTLQEGDTVKERVVKSLRDNQQSLFND